MGRFALLLFLISGTALADSHFYLSRPKSGIELICVGEAEVECQISESVNEKAVASKVIPQKEAESLFESFANRLKSIPVVPPKAKSKLRWNISYRGFDRQAIAGSDRQSLAPLLGIEADLKKRLIQ